MNLVEINLKKAIKASRKPLTASINAIINKITTIVLDPLNYDKSFELRELGKCYESFLSSLKIAYPKRNDIIDNTYEQVFTKYYLIFANKSKSNIFIGTFAPYSCLSDEAAVRIQCLFDTWEEIRKAFSDMQDILHNHQADEERVTLDEGLLGSL